MIVRAIVLGVLVALLTHPVAAAENEADVLFRMGRDATKRGDHATACRLFSESYALDPAVGTLHNIARCEEELGRIASASQRYREVVSRSEPSSERHQYATQRLRALEPRLPHLALRLASGSERAHVIIDGRVLTEAQLGTPFPVDPGRHVIEVRRQDGVTKTYDITLAEAERRVLEVEPVPRDAAVPPASASSPPAAAASASIQPPPPTRPDASRERPDSTLAWVLLGTGAAALTLSGISAIIVLDKKAKVEDDCDANLVCKTESGKNAADSGRTWSTIGTVAFVVGVVGVGAGTYLLVSARPEDKSAFVGVRARF